MSALAPERASYTSIHNRLARERGKASSHRCIDCGEAAHEWSWSWRRIIQRRWVHDARRGRIGRWFSLEVDDYDPRCRRCARRYDRSFRRVA